MAFCELRGQPCPFVTKTIQRITEAINAERSFPEIIIILIEQVQRLYQREIPITDLVFQRDVTYYSPEIVTYMRDFVQRLVEEERKKIKIGDILSFVLIKPKEPLALYHERCLLLEDYNSKTQIDYDKYLFELSEPIHTLLIVKYFDEAKSLNVEFKSERGKIYLDNPIPLFHGYMRNGSNLETIKQFLKKRYKL